MATRSTALRQAPAGARRQQPRSSLGVVDRRQLLEHAKARQARVLLALSGGVLAGALTIAAAGHALLASSQYRADGLQQAVSSAVATEQNLQAERAALETPSRVLALAKGRFKMVEPSGVTYLSPVNPGESVYQAHRASPALAASKSPRHRGSR